MYPLHHYILFTISEYVGCFSLLATLLCTWVCHYLFKSLLSIHLRYTYTFRNGILGPCGNSMLNNNHALSYSGSIFLYPTSSVQGFQFLWIFSNTCHFLCLFYNRAFFVLVSLSHGQFIFPVRSISSSLCFCPPWAGVAILPMMV